MLLSTLGWMEYENIFIWMIKIRDPMDFSHESFEHFTNAVPRLVRVIQRINSEERRSQHYWPT